MVRRVGSGEIGTIIVSIRSSGNGWVDIERRQIAIGLALIPVDSRMALIATRRVCIDVTSSKNSSERLREYPRLGRALGN